MRSIDLPGSLVIIEPCLKRHPRQRNFQFEGTEGTRSNRENDMRFMTRNFIRYLELYAFYVAELPLKRNLQCAADPFNNSYN